MSTTALTGNDSIIINNRLFTDLADGDCITLTYPSEIAQVKTGKNGNSLYALNETGKQSEVKIRVIRGSGDDKYLLNLLSNQQTNFAGTVLMIGEFIKQVGDGQGNLSFDTYVLSGGIFTKQIEAKMNVEGDTAQSIAEYHMKFSNAPRAIT